MNDLQSVPAAGSHVGHYQFLREVAKGPFGPLFELRSAAEAGGLGGLGRLLLLPDNLTPEVEQAISEAAWDSLELRHDFALCVADVVFGKGWITLVHDHSEGTLVRSLHRRAQERQSAFPVAIALRIALDLLEGLDRNRSVCQSAGIPWVPGGACASSLFLCGDGRARSLDGLVVTALTRLASVRQHVSVLGFPAPELLESAQELDERADVFAVGALLWELLTGRELALSSAVVQGQRPRSKAPNINLSLPKGATIPAALAQAINTALELDPSKRPATRNELRTMITAVAELAPYEKVIDFADALLHRESTLFRLTLDAGPKLSDELRHERPKPSHLEWATELAKRANAAEAKPSTVLPSTSVVPTAKPSSTAQHHPPGTNLSSLAPPKPAAAKKGFANKTLMGMNAPLSPSPQRSPGQEIMPSAPEGKAALMHTLVMNPTGAAPAAKPTVPAATAHGSSPAGASSSGASPAGASHTAPASLMHTLVMEPAGVVPAAKATAQAPAEKASAEKAPAAQAPAAQARTIQVPTAQVPVAQAPTATPSKQASPGHVPTAQASSAAPALPGEASPQVLRTQALRAQAITGAPIAAWIEQALPPQRITTNPVPPADGSPEPLIQQIAQLPATLAARPAMNSAPNLQFSQAPSGGRKFRLTLPVMVLAMLANSALSSVGTLIFVRSCSGSATRPTVTAASAASFNVHAAPQGVVSASAPVQAPNASAPVQAPNASAPVQAPNASAPIVGASEAAAPAPAVMPDSAAPAATRAVEAPVNNGAATAAPTPAKTAPRKRRQQYVPNEL